MFSSVRSRCLLSAILIGVLGCGTKPAPEASQAGGTKGAEEQGENPLATELRALKIPATPEAAAGDGKEIVRADQPAPAAKEKKTPPAPAAQLPLPPVVSPKSNIEEKSEAVPADTAVLELSVPEERRSRSTARTSGKNIATRSARCSRPSCMPTRCASAGRTARRRHGR